MTHQECLAFLYKHQENSIAYIMILLEQECVHPNIIASAFKAYYESI
jgi:hypothetical protein